VFVFGTVNKGKAKKHGSGAPGPMRRATAVTQPTIVCLTIVVSQTS
jgi:hypothetical protein